MYIYIFPKARVHQPKWLGILTKCMHVLGSDVDIKLCVKQI